MKLRDRVVRVAMRSSDEIGVLEERGTIERVYWEGLLGPTYGYTVLWDALPPRFPAPRIQYVSPSRIISVEEFAAARKTAAGGAA